MLKPNFAWAIQVPPDDKRIKAESASVPSPQGNGSIKGYLVRPANATKLPAIVVVHENRGLNPYIEDVARRLAVANFIAFAPDGLTSVGGYPGDEEKALALFGQVDRGKMTEDFGAAANWLKSRGDGTGKIGAVGFCVGGTGTTGRCATNPESHAAAAARPAFDIVSRAIIHKALGGMGRRHAASLKQCAAAAATIRSIDNNEVFEVRVVDENKALYRDQAVKSSTGIAPGINSGGKSRRADDHCAQNNSKPFHGNSPHLAPSFRLIGSNSPHFRKHHPFKSTRLRTRHGRACPGHPRGSPGQAWAS